MSDKGVDVERLMGEVNAIIASPPGGIERPPVGGRPPVYSFDYVYPHGSSLGIHFDMLSRRCEVGTVDVGSKRRLTGWLFVLAKRFVLLVTNWYMEPLTDEIRGFNTLMTRTLVDIDGKLEEIRVRLDALEEERGDGGR